MVADLAVLTAPHKVGILVSHVVQRRRLFLPAADRARVASLFSLAAFEQLIADGQVPLKHLRLMLDGRQVSMALYCDKAQSLPLPAAVRALYRQGVSAVIHHVEMRVPAIGQLTSELRERLAMPTAANAYLTWGRTPALSAHCDGHDVIVIQIAGAKRWFSYGAADEPIDAAGNLADVRTRLPEWEHEIRPGDMLYLPRGEIHRADPVDIPSLHITVGIDSVSEAPSCPSDTL
jgi:Cupin superfamily protein